MTSMFPNLGDPLSPREREVARLIVEGKQTKQIARELGISPKTIETHRASIRTKLGAQTVADIVRIMMSQETTVPVASA